MDSQSDADSPSFDEIVEALADIQRRRLLIELYERNVEEGETVSIDQLQSEMDALSQSLKLEHAHLPKLDEYQLIDYSRGDETFELGPAFSDIEPLLAALADLEDDLPPDVV